MSAASSYSMTVVCLRDASVRRVELLLAQRDLTVDDRQGWSLGPTASGACIPVEGALPGGVRLGVFFMGHHVVMMGLCPIDQELPAIGLVTERDGEPRRFTPHVMRAAISDTEERLYCRFDHHALRVGDHEIRLG